jgi:hypothetical protein
MGFPQLSNIDSRIINTIKQKAGNNLKASQTMPWIRVISCLENFLVIESSKETESFSQKYGNTSKSGRIGVDANNKDVYGNESTDRGYRPSPSINSISVSQGNEGLSKKTSFTITCYSLGQCEVVMEYFLEPGNMVLVEWGENSNLSIPKKCTPITDCSIAAYQQIKHVQKKRKDSQGTYDAILGTITGGSMSYGANETYEIQVELTSIGELPAYLQHHKGISDDKDADKNSTSKNFNPGQIRRLESKNVGKVLFMQMYNALPSHKRNQTIRNLVNDEWATNSSNFVNMDDKIRTKMIDEVKKGKLHSEDASGERLSITSETPLFSDKRFIRVALAFEILDLQEGIKMESEGTCPNVKPVKALVSWKNTICRAHKNMFSADSNFLYIPNKYAPAFNINKALATPKDLDSDEFTNPLPKLTAGQIELIGEQISDLHPKCYKNDNGSANSQGSYFPNNNVLDFRDQGDFDGSYTKVFSDAGQWGYLRDLYINFDFFCNTLESSGLVTKDVYYTLLNGMSSACNMYWDFQLVPRGAIKTHGAKGETLTDSWYNWKVNQKNDDCESNEELQVVDAGCVGKTPTGVGIAKFQSRGALTPFLSAELNFDIPGAMKGQVIGNKLSNNSKNAGSIKNPTAEQKEITFKGLFSNKRDSVLDALNSVKPAVDPPKEKTKGEVAKQEEEDIAELKKANYEYFVQNACVVPHEQDRKANMDLVGGFWDWNSSNNRSLDSFIKVGTWDDKAVLKRVQLYNEGLLKGNEAADTSLANSNPPLLPIKFTFSIHGVSGLKVGDTFSISDLPGKYNTKVFQVTQISHDIQQNIWTTSVEGSMRNMEAGGGDPKEYK